MGFLAKVGRGLALSSCAKLKCLIIYSCDSLADSDIYVTDCHMFSYMNTPLPRAMPIRYPGVESLAVDIYPTDPE